MYILLTIKSDSFKDSSQISNTDTIFSKHSRALDLTNGSLSCLRAFKTDIGKFFLKINLLKISSIQKI